MSDDTKLDTSEALMAAYKRASQQELMTRLNHAHEWKQYRQIEEETKDRLRQEEQDWVTHYDRRLAEAEQIILREAHGNVLEPPKPEGIAKVPDKDTLRVKADQRVRQDHQRRLTAIRKDEVDQYQSLRKKIEARDHKQGHAHSAFDQVRKRSGPSRS